MPTLSPGDIISRAFAIYRDQFGVLVPAALVVFAINAVVSWVFDSGLLALVAAVVALVWANSPWQASYYALWSTELNVELGDLVHLDLTLGEWVNDALMALFFFVVSLEIKRELTSGELSDPRKAALPVIGALGGMVVPAAIFLALARILRETIATAAPATGVLREA